MRKIQNDCVGCATETYPCIGNSCPFKNVEHIYCDKCGNELFDEVEIYEYEDIELCKECYEMLKGTRK